MSAIVEKFFERPRSHKIAFWVGTIAVFTFVFWQYGYSGLSKEIEDLQQKVDTLETDKVNEQRLARELPKVKAAVAELDIQLKKALLELPDKREIPDLLSSISNLAKDAGLEVSLFKPKPENFRDFYAEIPVQISVAGTYHQVASFFDEVGRLARIVNISDISMKEPNIEPGIAAVPVKTDCVATTFRYLDESERIQQNQTEDKRKKKGR